MTRIALIGTSTLIGEELKQELGRRRELWSDLRLLTFDPESAGKVSDIEGAAAFVAGADAETLADVDLVILPGESAAGRDLAAELPGVTVLVVSPDFQPPGGTVLVDGVNLADGRLPEAAVDQRLLVSPHPATIALSLVLHALRELSPARADCTLMLPSSMQGQGGLDELLEQSRRLLAFQSELPHAVFGRQLAFNLLPAADSAAAVVADLGALLGGGTEISLHLAQASVFHGCTLTLHLTFTGDTSPEAIREALAGGSFLSLPDETLVGPIDAAGRDDVQITGIARDGTAGERHFWVSAVFDNLTRGGAANALAIVEALATRRAN